MYSKNESTSCFTDFIITLSGVSNLEDFFQNNNAGIPAINRFVFNLAYNSIESSMSTITVWIFSGNLDIHWSTSGAIRLQGPHHSAVSFNTTPPGFWFKISTKSATVTVLSVGVLILAKSYIF
jgi:hypothetical protein